MAWIFTSDGNYVNFNGGGNLWRLHKDSNCISWHWDETGDLFFDVYDQEYTVKAASIGDVIIDSVPLSTASDFKTAIEAIFPGLAGGGAASYLVYTALLTQSGTDAPIATVLQNTLGETLTWSRSGAGFYKATAGTAIFPVAKTTVTGIISTLGAILNAANDENGEPSDRIYIGTSHHDGTQSDNLLYISPVEIKVHP